MAELHENQIAFQAGDTAKANIAAPKDYMTDALHGLADVADAAAEHMVAVEDNLLDQSIRSQLKATEQAIDDAKSLDADYSELRERAIGEFNSILNGASDAAKARYLKRYPTVMRDTIMLIDAKIATKVGNQIYTRLSNEVPRLSSEIITSPVEQQEALYNDAMILLNNPNLTLEQVESLTSKFRSQVDNGRVQIALASRDWNTARLLLDNPETTASISAPERAAFYSAMKSGIEKEQKEIADKLKLEKEAKDGNKKAQLTSVVLDTYKTMIDSGRYADAEAFRSDVFSGRPIITPDGYVLGSTNGWGAEFQSELSSKMASIAKNDPNMASQKAVVQTKYNDIIRPALNSEGKIDVASVDQKMYARLSDMAQNKYEYNYMLDDKTREQIAEMIAKYPDAAMEAFAPIDMFSKVPVTTTRPGTRRSYEGVSPIGNTMPIVNQYINDTVLSKSTPTWAGAEAANAKRSVRESLAVLKSRGFMSGVEEGTRAYGIYAMLVGMSATDQSVTKSFDNVGIKNVPSTVVMSAVLRTVGELQAAGLADDTPTLENLQSDFNRVYELAVGYQNRPDEDTKKLQDSLFNFAMSATIYPKDVSVTDYRNATRETDLDKKGQVLYPDYEFYNAFNALPEYSKDERQKTVRKIRDELSGAKK